MTCGANKMRIIVALLLSTLCQFANADSFYILVGYICDKKTDQLLITYDGAYNDAGREMLANKSQNQWDPWGLVVVKDEKYIKSLTPIHRNCRLSDGVYKITILPSPGNYNIQGACGASMDAKVEVKKGEHVIYTVENFEGRCGDKDPPIITRVVINAHNKKPQVTTVTQKEFYK